MTIATIKARLRAGATPRPKRSAGKCAALCKQRDALTRRIESISKENAAQAQRERSQIEARARKAAEKIEAEKRRALAQVDATFGKVCMARKDRKDKGSKKGPRAKREPFQFIVVGDDQYPANTPAEIKAASAALAAAELHEAVVYELPDEDADYADQRQTSLRLFPENPSPKAKKVAKAKAKAKAKKYKFGTVQDYATSDFVRPATRAERDASRAAAKRDGGAGAIADPRMPGRTIFVEG